MSKQLLLAKTTNERQWSRRLINLLKLDSSLEGGNSVMASHNLCLSFRCFQKYSE